MCDWKVSTKCELFNAVLHDSKKVIAKAGFEWSISKSETMEKSS
jgi:hypothetical protein